MTAMVERRTRIPVNDSTPDGGMALDERLLRAALAARLPRRATKRAES
ncbi:hypothetical protein [Streptomyces sp. NPDC054946]